MFFDRFVRKVDIQATLVCKTGLRVGAGKDSADVTASDLQVMRTRGEPFIPGSSLKGVLRSAIESLLRAAAPDETLAKAWACDRMVDPCLADKDLADGGTTANASERAKERRKKLQGLCRTCQTFGAPGLASHVLFRDAQVIGPARVERRDGVAIDRDLGRVSGARKYDFEVVPEGTRFRLSLTLDNAEGWQEGLVVVALELLHGGLVRIGGMTSRGLGVVALEGHEVRVVEPADLLQGKPPRNVPWAEYESQSKKMWTEQIDSLLGRKEVAPC